MYADHTHAQRRVPRKHMSLSLLLAAARNIVHGELMVRVPGGETHRFTGERDGPSAELIIHDPAAVRRVLTRSDTGFAEAYMAGEVDSPDLHALLELGALNERHLSRILAQKPWFRLAQRLYHLLRPNTRNGSRRNIRAHYDLGNAFYRLWLDDSMTYSSALFPQPQVDLAQAQTVKYRALVELLQLAPGDRVLEVGCGWGGFARLAAQEVGCHVTGLTLSREQLRHCEAVRAEHGLESRLDFRLQDYRDVDEQFDHLVSIEMFEAVGERYWPDYFRMLARCLRPGGRAALQIITINDEAFPSYREGCDFIQRYIFPGGMLAPAGRVRELAAEAGLTTCSQAFHGEHYVRTLEHWSNRFNQRLGEVKALGFDERFVRMWRYYLAYCRAGFANRHVNLMQTLLSKPAEATR
jgi:cyclopropane-fatty-acyl-phospholipid synthase